MYQTVYCYLFLSLRISLSELRLPCNLDVVKYRQRTRRAPLLLNIYLFNVQPLHIHQSHLNPFFCYAQRSVRLYLIRFFLKVKNCLFTGLNEKQGMREVDFEVSFFGHKQRNLCSFGMSLDKLFFWAWKYYW